MASNGVKKDYFLGFRGQKWPERVNLENYTLNFGQKQGENQASINKLYSRPENGQNYFF